MKNITIYYSGGNVVLQDCNDECVDAIIKWLDNSKSETFKIDVPSTNRTKIFRKDLILFVDID